MYRALCDQLSKTLGRPVTSWDGMRPLNQTGGGGPSAHAAATPNNSPTLRPQDLSTDSRYTNRSPFTTARLQPRVPQKLSNSLITVPCITQIEPNLYLGNYAAAERLDYLRANRITAVVTLKWTDAYSELRSSLPWTGLVARNRHLYVQISDNLTTDMLCFLDQICDFIDTMKASPPAEWNGEANVERNSVKPASAVLVHCQAGVSRSVTTIMAYMMRRHRYDKFHVHAYLNLVHPRTKPNSIFYKQLDVWEQCGYLVWEDESRTTKKKAYAAFSEKHLNVLPSILALEFISKFFQIHGQPYAAPDRGKVEIGIQDLWAKALKANGGVYDHPSSRMKMPLTLNMDKAHTNTIMAGSTSPDVSFTTPCGELGIGFSWSNVPKPTRSDSLHILESDPSYDDFSARNFAKAAKTLSPSIGPLLLPY